MRARPMALLVGVVMVACTTSESPTGSFTCLEGTCPAGYACVEVQCLPTGSGSGGDASGACAGEVGPDGQCFEAFAVGSTYADARATCEGRGGHLATIKDRREGMAVEAVMTGASWIGLAGGSGTFAWITGEPFTYDDWMPSEPDVSVAAACVQATVAGWRVIPCGTAAPYVCER